MVRGCRNDNTPKTADEPHERGFAIVVVLAMLSLLALVAIILQKTITVDISLTANLVGQAHSEALADGLTRLGARHLMVNAPANNRSGTFRLDGVPLTCRTGAGFASISFTNTDGLINLNLASQKLLERVVTGAGLEPSEAARLAQDIVDFRTPSDLSLAGGSKLVAYQQAGLSQGPKTNLFQSVGELEQVIGITPALLVRLRPLFTVASRSGTVNPSLVSWPVAAALAGAVGAPSDAQTLDVLKTRLVLPPEFTAFSRSGRGPVFTTSNTYLVRVIASHGTAARFVREAIFDLTASQSGDATLKEWTERDRDLYAIDPQPTDETPPCIGGLLWLDPAT